MEKVTHKKGCGVIIINNENKILLGQRVKAKTNEIAMQWCIPGGGIEHNEMPIIGAIREVEEETSLIINSENLSHIAMTNQRAANSVTTDHTFATKIYYGEVKDNPSEMINYKWFSINEILNLSSSGKIYPATIVSIANYMNYIAHLGKLK